ncbi:MAG: SdiA-regulated domain-containing protein [Gammaproteobacteria bacterium]|nr:SdiA-regulated domain-containing protein [Gammaproteobacteria bacterium]MDH4255795.1 SdiA-regulated domain-containing protein [Gammaproteobacteria bacterium]MDH5309238.1 SdiA-regulated domain-containing protein [Gammaproteobacteria bacterium]
MLAACNADVQEVPELARRYGLAGEPGRHWSLPGKLYEISGLALTGDGRLFAVNDERAVIYEVDYLAGGLRKAFTLGDPAIRGDFEGIAHDGTRFWLVTSDGDLFAAPEGADGARVEYERQETGFGRRCEIEGLAWHRARLLVLCKATRRDEELSVYAWDSEAAIEDESAGFELPVAAILEHLGIASLHPSGLAVDSGRGTLLLIAARERVLVELGPAGEFLGAIELPLAGLHPQAEGIEVTESGTLIIADEGGGGRARLAVYSAAPLTKPEEEQ